MAEELDVKARLTADDDASPVVRRLQANIARMKKQLEGMSSGRERLSGAFVNPKLIKHLAKESGALDTITPRYLKWARAQRDAGRLTMQLWDDLSKKHDTHVESLAKGHGKMSRSMRDAARHNIRQMTAFTSVWNAEHEKRLGVQRRIAAEEDRIEGVRQRQRLQAEREEGRSHARRQRSMMRNLRDIGGTPSRMMNRLDGNGFFNSPTFYGIAAGTAAVAAGRSATRSAVDLDKAETFARMHMDQSIVNARQLRDQWALPKAVELGQSPANLMMNAVEAAKAGVPDALAAGTAEMVMQIAKVFGIEMNEAMDGMGYAIAQELGAGRMKGDDIGGVRRLGNTAAFLAGKTAARPDQMLSFLRTGLGSGAMLGMKQDTTLAFGAAAIQAGAQGQQAARMLGSMAEDINKLESKAKDIRRKHTRSENDKLFLRLPGLLGYGGGFGEISRSFREKPETAMFDFLKSFGKIKDDKLRDRALTAIFGADFKRFYANMVASPEMLDRTAQLAKEAYSQTQETDFLSKSWGEFTNGLEFFLNRIKAAWSVIKSELGDTLKPFFLQFSDWVRDWYKAVGTGGLKQRFSAILNGLNEGFLGRPGTFRDLLDQIFGKPGEGSAGNVESFFRFAKGFAQGLKSVWETIKSVFTTVAKAFGIDSSDPEAMGQFAAKLIGFTVALHFLRPVISVLGLLVDGLMMLGKALALLGPVAAIGAVATLLAKVGNWINKDRIDEVQNNKKEKGRGLGSGIPFLRKQSFDGDTDFSGSARVHKASYNDLGKSVDKLNNKFEQYGVQLQLAAFSPSNTGGLSRAGSAGGGGGRSGGGPSIGNLLGGGSSGSVQDLFTNKPGSSLPSIPGITRRGILGGLDGIPGGQGGAGGGRSPFSPGGIFSNEGADAKDRAWMERGSRGSGGSGGSDGGGSSAPSQDILQRFKNTPGSFGARAPGVMGRLMKDFGLSKEQAAGIVGNLGAESGLQAINEKNPLIPGSRGGFGWAQWTGPRRRAFENWAKVKGLDPKSDEANYGFLAHELRTSERGSLAAVRRQTTAQGAMRAFEQSYERAGIKNYAGRAKFTERALNAFNANPNAGSSAADAAPNVGTSVADSFKKTPGSDSWLNGLSGYKDGYTSPLGIPGRAYRMPGSENPLTQSVPGNIIQNVPPPAASSPEGMVNAMGGGGGPVSININGGGHDPESLALLVQRRVSEQMNWQSHDVEHDMA
jgi:hypothetical protein